MQNPTYLALSRHKVYYFRYPIPRGVHPRMRASHVRVSLNTREPYVALQLAKVLSHLAELLIARMSARHMRYDDIRTVLKQHFIELLEKRKRGIAEQGRLGELDKTALENSIGLAEYAIEHGEPLSPFRDDKHVLGPFMDRHGLVLDEGSPPYETLRIEFKRAFRSYCQAVLDHDQSLDQFHLEERGTATATKSENAAKGIVLGTLIEQYIDERMRGGTDAILAVGLTIGFWSS